MNICLHRKSPRPNWALGQILQSTQLDLLKRIKSTDLHLHTEYIGAFGQPDSYFCNIKMTNGIALDWIHSVAPYRTAYITPEQTPAAIAVIHSMNIPNSDWILWELSHLYPERPGAELYFTNRELEVEYKLRA
mgnify:FL=1